MPKDIAHDFIDPTPDTYEAFQTAFDHFNADLFEGKLSPCLITLQRKRGE